MSDHADIVRAALKGTVGPGFRQDCANAALDALVAERDEWKRHYKEARELSGDDQTRAEAAEARVEQLEAALRACASTAGHVDAAEGCRLIVRIVRAALASSGSEGDAACPYACQTNDNANTPCPHCDA